MTASIGARVPIVGWSADPVGPGGQDRTPSRILPVEPLPAPDRSGKSGAVQGPGERWRYTERSRHAPAAHSANRPAAGDYAGSRYGPMIAPAWCIRCPRRRSDAPACGLHRSSAPERAGTVRPASERTMARAGPGEPRGHAGSGHGVASGRRVAGRHPPVTRSGSCARATPFRAALDNRDDDG